MENEDRVDAKPRPLCVTDATRHQLTPFKNEPSEKCHSDFVLLSCIYGKTECHQAEYSATHSFVKDVTCRIVGSNTATEWPRMENLRMENPRMKNISIRLHANLLWCSVTVFYFVFFFQLDYGIHELFENVGENLAFLVRFCGQLVQGIVHAFASSITAFFYSIVNTLHPVVPDTDESAGLFPWGAFVLLFHISAALIWIWEDFLFDDSQHSGSVPVFVLS